MNDLIEAKYLNIPWGPTTVIRSFLLVFVLAANVAAVEAAD
jgi:hypothetical protein